MKSSEVWVMTTETIHPHIRHTCAHKMHIKWICTPMNTQRDKKAREGTFLHLELAWSCTLLCTSEHFWELESSIIKLQTVSETVTKGASEIFGKAASQWRKYKWKNSSLEYVHQNVFFDAVASPQPWPEDLGQIPKPWGMPCVIHERNHHFGAFQWMAIVILSGPYLTSSISCFNNMSVLMSWLGEKEFEAVTLDEFGNCQEMPTAHITFTMSVMCDSAGW